MLPPGHFSRSSIPNKDGYLFVARIKDGDAFNFGSEVCRTLDVVCEVKRGEHNLHYLRTAYSPFKNVHILNISSWREPNETELASLEMSRLPLPDVEEFN